MRVGEQRGSWAVLLLVLIAHSRDFTRLTAADSGESGEAEEVYGFDGVIIPASYDGEQDLVLRVSIREGVDPYVQCNEYCREYEKAFDFSRQDCNRLMYLIEVNEAETPTPISSRFKQRSQVSKNDMLNSITGMNKTSITAKILISIPVVVNNAATEKLEKVTDYVHIYDDDGDALKNAIDQMISICIKYYVKVHLCDDLLDQMYKFFNSERPDPSSVLPIHTPRRALSGSHGEILETRRVLITGGAGFLGRHFAHHLCNEGWHVTVIDDMSAPHSLLPQHWPTHLQCLKNPVEFRKVDMHAYFESPHCRKKWEVVIHLAAVLTNLSNDSLTMGAKNIELDAAAFKWAVNNISKPLPDKLIFFSNLKYDWTKIAGENMAKLAFEQHGLDVRVYRCSSIYGEDLDISYPLNVIFDKIISYQSDVTIDIDSKEDFVYVEDVVDFVVSTMDAPRSLDNLFTNVATGTLHELSSLAYGIAAQSGIAVVDDIPSTTNTGDKYFVDSCDNCFRNITEGIETVIQWRKKSSLSKSHLSTKSKKMKGDVYSSFHCSGGNQHFRNWRPNSLGTKNFTSTRVCMLKNVCFSDREMIYYMHPEEMKSPSYISYFFDQEFVRLSSLGHEIWRPKVVEESLPSDVPFKDDKTWIFTFTSYSFNYAHLLVDDIFAGVSALELFNEKVSNARILSTGCRSFPLYCNYYKPYKSQAQACLENFKYYSKLVLGTESEDLGDWKGQSFCLKKVIVGSGHVLGLVPKRPDKYRAIALRKGRDAIIEHLPHDSMVPPDRLKVVLIPKRSPGHNLDNIWRDMCDDVTKVVLGIAHVEIYCLEEGLSVEEEISVIRTATVIISEHGTVAYLALFAHDGAVLINISSQEDLKDIHILPYATHIRIFYTTLDIPEEFPAMIRYSLHVAATNFDLVLDDYVVSP